MNNFNESNNNELTIQEATKNLHDMRTGLKKFNDAWIKRWEERHSNLGMRKDR